MNKYGEKQFAFSRLQFGFGAERETRLKFETILLSTLPPEMRYNTYVHWRTRSRETNAFCNKRHSTKTRDALSQALSGRPSSFFAKKQSNRVKEIISKHNAQGGNKKKGVYIDNTFYESISEAWQITGLSRRLIRKYCASPEKRHANYRWAEISKDILVEDFTNQKPNLILNESLNLPIQEKVTLENMPTDVQKMLHKIFNHLDQLKELIEDKDVELQKEIVSSLQEKIADVI